MEHGSLTLRQLQEQAARARRLAWQIPADPMGWRLEAVANELEAEVARLQDETLPRFARGEAPLPSTVLPSSGEPNQASVVNE